MTRKDAIEFLDEQHAENFLSNPIEDKKTVMVAVVVEVKKFPQGGPLKTKWLLEL